VIEPRDAEKEPGNGREWQVETRCWLGSLCLGRLPMNEPERTKNGDMGCDIQRQQIGALAPRHVRPRWSSRTDWQTLLRYSDFKMSKGWPLPSPFDRRRVHRFVVVT
jgi:hypothetical protein